MSLLSSMLTSLSGMNGQADKVQSVASNIANSSTSGYKRIETLFQDLSKDGFKMLQSGGGITAHARQNVTQQGEMFSSARDTDLAIEGLGMLVFQDQQGRKILSRDGALSLNAEGELVSSTGLKLLGYRTIHGVDSDDTDLSRALEVIKLNPQKMSAVPTDKITMSVNLPAHTDLAVPGSLPSLNLATSKAHASTSVTAYDDLGAPVTLNLHFAKIAESKWEISVYDSVNKSGEPFPYTSGPIHMQEVFVAQGGKVPDQEAIFVLPGGTRSIKVSLQDSTQLAGPFALMKLDANGSAAKPNGSVLVDNGGYVRYSNVGGRAEFRIPLANSIASNNLSRLNGAYFTESTESGPVILGYPNEGGLGTIRSGFLENSTVDLGQELTDMLQAQRNYAANSKVFKSSGDMLEILIGLKN